MSVTRVRVTLRVFPGSLTAESISRRLDMASDQAHEIGELNPRNGKTWTAAQWSIKSTLPESEPLSAHLVQLLNRVERVATELQALYEEGVAMDWFCFIDRENGQGGPSFSPELMRRLGALPIVLELDVY